MSSVMQVGGSVSGMMEASVIRVGQRSLSLTTRTSVEILHPAQCIILSFQDFL